jgi:hypothetical protein
VITGIDNKAIRTASRKTSATVPSSTDSAAARTVNQPVKQQRRLNPAQ